MKHLKTTVDAVVTILIVVAASLVIWRQLVPAGRPQTGPPVEDAKGMIPAELATTVRGTGQVALVEFADFECPFCGRHARDVEPEIVKTFIDTGVVRQVFVNYPLGSHRQAEPASAAAVCAGKQGKFWEMRDALLRNQSALQETNLADRARELKLDLAAFSQCAASKEARSLIERQKSTAQALGVRSTPSFFVGTVQVDGSVLLKKRINGALPFNHFRSAITEVIPEELKNRIAKGDV